MEGVKNKKTGEINKEEENREKKQEERKKDRKVERNVERRKDRKESWQQSEGGIPSWFKFGWNFENTHLRFKGMLAADFHRR